VREKNNISDFGLKFMFDIMKELDLQVDVIEVIYTAICKIATKKPEEAAELLVVPEGAEEEEKDRIEEENTKIKEANEMKEKENAKIAKLQTKIIINTRNPDDYDEDNEKALLKLNNYRETFTDENGKVLSARTGGSNLGGDGNGESIDPDEEFNPDKIPTKLLITKTTLPEAP